MTEDLLLEIGVEELPSSFVAGALEALPALLAARLGERRLAHGAVRALGTPRRLAAIVEDVALRQDDLDEELVGPPVRVAFGADGRPTRAAVSFAERCGVPVEALERRETPKGEYLVGRKREIGQPAHALLPSVIAETCRDIPFRKSMRWGSGEATFGRPVRWLLARLGTTPIDFEFAGLRSGTTTRGHRFLAPDPVTVPSAGAYVDLLRERRVLVDPAERRAVLLRRLEEAAAAVGGVLIPDAFLVEENLSLVEEPVVVTGGFSEEFLVLPERVILDVARGHQRYFGVRGRDGRLLPVYLAVVNTALSPENVRRGNDRVMRARLSDARFFWEADLAVPLGSRREKLDGITFQKRLGSVGDKVRRLLVLLPALAPQLGVTPRELATATAGAELAKCDLTSLMVGEFPELEGEMGRAYALRQGVAPEIAEVIAEHHHPRGADDPTASTTPGALLALADRLDTLTGCFAIGLVPTGSADPLALRRAALGLLRTLLDRDWPLDLEQAVLAAHATYQKVQLDLDAATTAGRLGEFLRERLRGLLTDTLPADVVEACLAADARVPTDVRARAQALAGLDHVTRARAGEVLKRAANIAKDAPAGAPRPPSDLPGAPPEELALWSAFRELGRTLEEVGTDYPRAFGAIAAFYPVLAAYFDAVFVMVEDTEVRENRLRLMAAIERACSRIAHLNHLAPAR